MRFLIHKKLIHTLITLSTIFVAAPSTGAQKVEPIKFGNFDQWITRNITESKVLGGNDKKLYEVGPTMIITGNKPYSNMGGSPWATSNVYAKVSGISKGSNAIYPASRGGNNMCAKLCTQMDHIKVLGMINMNVMVAGSMFLGEMIEPISSTSNPYSKMEMGMKYNKRPSAVVLDYKVDMPDTDTRVKSTGFGSKKVLKGRDNAVAFVILQRRWEDADGNLHAKRVGTGGELFSKTTQWTNGHRIPIKYGDVSTDPTYSWLGLRQGDNAYYARNSKGKLVKVEEEGWDSPDATPTHVILMLSAGNGEPYIGTEGLTLYVDNVGFVF